MTIQTIHTPTPGAVASGGLFERRIRTLGRHSPLFYANPLEIVSAEGVWVRDATGNTYLDVYNNVPHVGHSNPVVAEAITAQLRSVNLHTRYLNRRVIEYAEKLLATFDAPLDRVFFTNSGSEANELALRIARQHTGNTGVLVSDHSYHGNTTSIAELTTALKVKEPLGAHVRPLRIPDATGLSPAKERLLLRQALEELDVAISSLEETGYGVSAFLFDPLFSTEGMLRTPRGYIDAVSSRVRKAGGLVLADEVQSGFGRIGAHMWGHQLFETIPDLVTLGKPMGNGHPVGGVITNADLMEQFGQNNTYFNTFAGNPVSASAGLAVLQVIEDQELLENARRLGVQIAAELRSMTDGNSRVRNVRGAGLFFGLEIVRPDGSGPDAESTKALVEGLLSRGVLIGRIGHEDNVLKMRPPLVFESKHAEHLLEQVQHALAALDRNRDVPISTG